MTAATQWPFRKGAAIVFIQDIRNDASEMPALFLPGRKCEFSIPLGENKSSPHVF
jgi:hypothetical protein